MEASHACTELVECGGRRFPSGLQCALGNLLDLVSNSSAKAGGQQGDELFRAQVPAIRAHGRTGRKRLFLYDTTEPESIAWAKASVKSRHVVPRCDVKKVLGERGICADGAERARRRSRFGVVSSLRMTEPRD